MHSVATNLLIKELIFLISKMISFNSGLLFFERFLSRTKHIIMNNQLLFLTTCFSILGLSKTDFLKHLNLKFSIHNSVTNIRKFGLVKALRRGFNLLSLQPSLNISNPLENWSQDCLNTWEWCYLSNGSLFATILLNGPLMNSRVEIMFLCDGDLSDTIYSYKTLIFRVEAKPERFQWSWISG